MNEKINKPLRTVYMGTPLFAVRSLRALCETEDVILVVTQPDRPAGRGRKMTSCPVKEEAVRRGITVLQPERVKDKDVIARIRETSCDLIVVAAFGQILPAEILEIPAHGCINIHASLLPRYRGPSPIPAAIIHGERETGITTMLMDAGMDTGDILLQTSLEILDDETAGDLSERLSTLGAEVLTETLEAMEQGRLKKRKQSESEATYTALLDKKQGEIDWNRDPRTIRNLVRGMAPWPGAYTLFQGEALKVWRVSSHDASGPPGEVLSARDRLIVGAQGGSVIIDEMQIPGKKRMSGSDFLRGHRDLGKGTVFGR